MENVLADYSEHQINGTWFECQVAKPKFTENKEDDEDSSNPSECDKDNKEEAKKDKNALKKAEKKKKKKLKAKKLKEAQKEAEKLQALKETMDSKKNDATSYTQNIESNQLPTNSYTFGNYGNVNSFDKMEQQKGLPFMRKRHTFDASKANHVNLMNSMMNYKKMSLACDNGES